MTPATPIARSLNRADWSARITATFRSSFEAIIQTGCQLAAAKSALPHGEFLAMLREDLPFREDTAQRLMAISRDERITNAAHGRFLPASWRTLFELTRLSDEEFEQGKADGTINPQMKRKDIERKPPKMIDVTPERRDDAEIIDIRPDPPAAPVASPAPTPSNSRTVMASRQEPDDSFDFAPTPPWGTRALIEKCLPQLGMRSGCGRQVVHEPACGEGHMAEVLAEYFGEVVATDIKDYGYSPLPPIDFLSRDPAVKPDWIITNPPFNKAEEFVTRALDIARIGVAVFVRWQWIEGVGRYERLFNLHCPALVCPFAERIPLHMGRWEPDGSTASAYCWIVWRVTGDNSYARLFWIPPGCRKSLSKPDDIDRFTASPVIRKLHQLQPPDVAAHPTTGAADPGEVPAFLRRKPGAQP